MKHFLILLAAAICFSVATFAMWFNRAQLATSIPLLAFVGGFYLLGFGLAIPSNMKAAGEAVAGAVQALKGAKPDGTV